MLVCYNVEGQGYRLAAEVPERGKAPLVANLSALASHMENAA